MLASESVKSDESPDYMVKHFILANFVDSYGTRLKETGCFSITKVQRFGKKSLDIMVVFYGTSCLAILGDNRDIQILK